MEGVEHCTWNNVLSFSNCYLEGRARGIAWQQSISRPKEGAEVNGGQRSPLCAVSSQTDSEII